MPDGCCHKTMPVGQYCDDCSFKQVFTYKIIELHGRKKLEIVYAEGEQHVAYLNDETETKNLVRLLNRK